MPKLSDRTAADLFLEVGRLIEGGDDWKGRYAADLGVPTSRIKDIDRGKADANDLLTHAWALAENRAEAAVKARDMLRAHFRKINPTSAASTPAKRKRPAK